jgi:hypothetical protein
VAHSLRGRWNGAGLFAAPPRSEWPLALRRARTIGFVLLVIQFVGFCWWSSVLTHHFALTWDFAAYEQAASLIGHGHLDPYSTVLSTSFVRNDYEFLIWLVAPLQRLWPHPMTLKVLQALALVAAEAVALDWMSDIAAVRVKHDRKVAAAVSLVALGTLLLVVNPWILWTVSFDVHMEPFLTLFVLAAARDLFRGRRRVWLWIACALICGAASVAYIGALGISAALNGRRWWRQGVAMLVIAVVWTLGLEAVIGPNTNGLGVYAYILDGNALEAPKHVTGGMVISSALKYPGRDLHVLWGNALNIWGSLSPVGLIGVFWLPLTIPIAGVTLLSGFTASVDGFSAPGFQNVALEVFVALGTVALCSALAGRFSGRQRWVLPSVMAIVAVNAAVWAAIWLPQTGIRWTPNNSSKASETLANLRDRIKPGDEVVAENGVAGAFAEDRESLFTIKVATLSVPVRARRVWVIFAPAVGIEIKAPEAQVYSDIAKIAADPGMRLVTDSNGIWAFEWYPPKGARTLRIGPPSGVAPAWMLPGPGGAAVDQGKSAGWYVASTGKPGYVVAHGYARELPGTYRADVSLSASGAANVELWDATTSTLLQRRSLTGTHGRTMVRLTARVLHTPGQQVYSGWGPWSIQPVAAPPGDNLEIRVWQPGGKDRVRVYSTGLSRVSGRT